MKYIMAGQQMQHGCGKTRNGLAAALFISLLWLVLSPALRK